MIIDTSALIAILFAEPEGKRLYDAIVAAPSVGMSAANLVEYSIVAERRGTEVQRRLADAHRRELGIHIEPVTADQAMLASSAHRAFGRGSGHAAKLTFGDCFAYALAIDKDEPLLFVGDDFAHTDVRPARLP